MDRYEALCLRVAGFPAGTGVWRGRRRQRTASAG